MYVRFIWFLCLNYFFKPESQEMTKRVSNKTRAIVMGNSEFSRGSSKTMVGVFNSNSWDLFRNVVGIWGWTVTHSQHSWLRGRHFKIQSHCYHISGLNLQFRFWHFIKRERLKPGCSVGWVRWDQAMVWGWCRRGFLEPISMKGSKCLNHKTRLMIGSRI